MRQLNFLSLLPRSHRKCFSSLPRCFDTPSYFREAYLDLGYVTIRGRHSDRVPGSAAQRGAGLLKPDERTRLGVDDAGHVHRDRARAERNRVQELGGVSLPECDGDCLLHELVLPADGFFGLIQEGPDRVRGCSRRIHYGSGVSLGDVDERENASIGRFPTANDREHGLIVDCQ